MQYQPQTYTVSAITRIIKGNLEESLGDVWIEGEISNYVHHTSGHRYLNLKDDRAVIKVTIWRSIGNYLRFEPENGQKVLAYGNITVYEKGGIYQLNCRKLVPAGVGELEIAFRQLYEKLAAEGLFDEDRKQLIPRFARKIGVVTSPTGAAIRDIVQIARRRNVSVELVIYPAQVQGEGAEHTIANGIDYFNSRSDIDIIITGRGGGSLEDLWPFNTEMTVRAIAASRVPVISAVGHEVDTTLSDLAADLRAPTPSAASELAVWSKREFTEQTREAVERQAAIMKSMLRAARQDLFNLLNRPVFTRPHEQIRQNQQYLDQLTRTLASTGKNSFEKHRNRLSLLAAQLESMSPLKILARGYSVSYLSPARVLLKSVSEINPGDRMETVFGDGRIVSLVEESSKER